jgi:hypothetical protein
MTLFVALNAVIGFLVALLHDERKWQLAVLYFALASGYLSWAFQG